MINSKQVILIRLGELCLKGKNRNFFINKLINDIKSRIIDKEYKLINEFDRLFIDIKNNDDIPYIAEILKHVPGIHSFSICYELQNDINLIHQALEIILNNITILPGFTFKINCCRNNKLFPLNSKAIIDKLAPMIIDKYHLKVKMEKPDISLHIEIRSKFCYVFSNFIMGIGGLPNNSGNHVLSLLSGGIDSPVASYLITKKGQIVDYITFIVPPYTSDMALQKVCDLVKQIKQYSNRKARLYVCNFTKVMQEISHISFQNYRIIIMRRLFFRIAQTIAKENNCLAIATGESLGQVASQTLESMTTINSAIDLPVLRPLLTMDKQEIITIAKNINTYNLSILPYDDACAVFVPSSVTTKPKIGVSNFLEKQMPLLNDLVNLAIQHIEIKEI